MSFDKNAESALARRSLLDFATLMYPRFSSPPHIRLIAGLLEEIEYGKRIRLGLSVGVRHGKSVLTSQLFAAWYLGRHPDRNVILASHSEDLATRNSRVAKHFLEDDRWPFPNVKLSSDSTAAARWNTTAGGGAYGIGVGGNVTGRGCDLCLIDDALHDGLSEGEREATYLWYSEVMTPRLEPGAAVVLIGARFAEDDLLGRILESEDGPNWVRNIVNLPALAIEGEVDPLGRAPGEALWPERFSADELNMRRVSMGSKAFEAQFQQRPRPAGGAVFKEAWMNRRYRFGDHPEGLRIIQSIDSAWKESVSADWSVIATWGATKTHFYLLDVWRQQCEFPKLKAAVLAQRALWEPIEIVVEQAASGWAIVQSLRDETSFPFIGIPSTSSKISRAEAVSPLFEAGRIVLPDNAPWLPIWFNEHIRFPSRAVKDDCVDTTSLALNRLAKWSQGGGDWYWGTLSTVANPDADKRIFTRNGVYEPPPPKPVKASPFVWPKGVNPAKPKPGNSPLPGKW
jgi:predicted phage terminase large subunit-like protein